MDNVLDGKTLKNIPPIFTFFLVLIFGSPALTLFYYGVDLNTADQLPITAIPANLNSFFVQILLEWSAFFLAIITVLFAFIQYRLTNDKIAFIIGLSVLFSGFVEGLHTLLINHQPYLVDKANIDSMIWTLTNTVSGVILAMGLLFLFRNKNPELSRWSTFTLTNILLIILAIACLYYIGYILHHPTMWSRDNYIARPYELSYLAVYLVIVLFIYPNVYKKYPFLLTNCIFYISISQVIIAIYLMLLSNISHESAYNIAFSLKIIVYLIPFTCLIINYIFSYNTIVEAQQKLQNGQEKLQYLATRDPLTNLYNRREFEHLLDKAIANSSRNMETFALFLIDIDNFKSINDTLGHIYGDHFLKQFSEQLVSLTRRGDILARVGGDEFIIITSSLKMPSMVKKLAERIVDGLNIPFNVEEKLLTGTVSVGVSVYPFDGNSTDELFKNADIAMYNAKKSGKNTYRCYTEKISNAQYHEAEIESYLREALTNNELCLHYQPQYNLITKEVVGAEILLRWNSTTLGNVSPEEFIPIAENSNLIISIGNWVLQKACEQAKQWAEKYQRHLLFSINVSPVQFESNNFYPNFKKTLETYDFPANYICVEITENLLMKSNEVVSLALQNIGTLGSIISLDDFGMGYSSLSRLQSLPINTLKIDKLFVANIHHEHDKVIVIDTIIKLAHELGMNVVAEGIENETQLNYLVSKNCFLGQGYLLSKPIPADLFEKLVYKSE